ncbi:MAG: hypothetical protein ACRYG7_00615 [Janthinobacterium lividum]
MDATSPSPADSAAIRLPYAKASAAYISYALVFLQAELASHYLAENLPWLTWANALDHLRPDLWVSKEGVVSLHAQDVRHLTQHLTGSPELLTREPVRHRPRAAYLAKCLVNYAEEALEALDELEAGPRFYGPRVWNLVLGLALGNSTADQVYRDTWREKEKVAKPVVDGPTVHARVFALRQARGEYDFPTGPPRIPLRTRTKT